MAAAENGGRVERVEMDDAGRIETHLDGPAHPLKPEAPALSVALKIEAAKDSASVTLGEETRVLKVGEWSAWWTVPRQARTQNQISNRTPGKEVTRDGATGMG